MPRGLVHALGTAVGRQQVGPGGSLPVRWSSVAQLCVLLGLHRALHGLDSPLNGGDDGAALAGLRWVGSVGVRQAGQHHGGPLRGLRKERQRDMAEFPNYAISGLLKTMFRELTVTFQDRSFDGPVTPVAITLCTHVTLQVAQLHALWLQCVIHRAAGCCA